MLNIYRDTDPSLHAGRTDEFPSEIIWLDLFDPTPEERKFVEDRAQVRIPSREELSEIEASSRLGKRNGYLYLSTPVIGRSTIEEAELSPAGFILGKSVLVTLRYTTLPTFEIVAERLKTDDGLDSSTGVFVTLLEAIVDRGADVLELLGAAIDELSRSLFRGKASKLKNPSEETATLRQTLSRVGAFGDRLSKARDALLGIGRIASFTLEAGHEWISEEFKNRLHAVEKDVTSLSDYETHLSDKIQFLLDAVLGYITIEQNDIFKVLTIASVVGVPPTLLAGIWGMNFKFMPELSWTWGYPMGWAAIVLSAILPLTWFWRRGWF